MASPKDEVSPKGNALVVIYRLAKRFFELLKYHFLKTEQLNNAFSNLLYVLYDKSHDIAGMHPWNEGNKE